MNLKPIMEQYKNVLKGEISNYFSPGRVNLIGEHIDYLGGNVFPTAIDLGIYAMVSKRDDNQFYLVSHNFLHVPGKVVACNELQFDSNRGWANYPVGMIDAFVQRGLELTHGLTIVFYGNLPNGAGLSSSASLEVLMGIILEDQYNYHVPRIELVQIAKQVENQYIGVNCGIMDQFAVGMSKRDHAIYLNTNTLEYELVPLQLPHHTIIIANTNVKRGLVDSKYNDRRQECELGLNTVQQVDPSIQHLCDVSIELFTTIQHLFPSEEVRKRVRHAITEQHRTKQAVQALKQNDILMFGQLLQDGHKSLRDDFEVSCLELDVLQQAFLQYGALGARMTGAGFGGCVVAIVPSEQVDYITKQVQQEYAATTSYQADCYICQTSDGAKKISKEVSS